MSKKKLYSKIWTKFNDVEFSDIVRKCKSFNEVHAYIGSNNKGGNNKTLHKRISNLDLSIDHFNKCHTAINLLSKDSIIPLTDILVENSSYNRTRLKKRLISDGLLLNKCIICGQLPWWNNKPLVLHLDHINGIHNDNRLENLRILCPHCHSQTNTFAGKNSKRIYVCECGNVKCKTSKYCASCNDINKRTTLRPDVDTLLSEVKEHGYYKLRSKYGVSDNAIRKWVKAYGFNPKTFEPL